MKTTITITWRDNNPKIKETDFTHMIGIALGNQKMLGSVESVKVTEASEIDGATLQRRTEQDLFDEMEVLTAKEVLEGAGAKVGKKGKHA